MKKKNKKGDSMGKSKKFWAVCITLVTVICLSVILSGCDSFEEALFSQVDLAKEAQIVRADTGQVKNGKTNVVFSQTQTFNTIVLRENADKTTEFKISVKNEGEWQEIYRQDRIDRYRLCSFETTSAQEIEIEILSASGSTKIDSIEVYNVAPKQSAFRVSAYMTTSKKSVQERKNDEGFTGYFNVITDLILIGEINVDENAQIVYAEGEEDFTADVAALREAIGERDVKIYCSIGVKQNSSNKETADFLHKNASLAAQNISAFLQKYNFDGVDYDWEYPENIGQWKAYDKLIILTASMINPLGKNVSVALAPWGAGFSKEAKEKIEYVNVMAYDIFDERGDHASIYETGAKAVKQMMDLGFSKKQIFLGLSFYGRTTNKSGDAWPDYAWDYAQNNASLGKWGNYIPNFEYTTSSNQKEVCGAYLNGFAMNRDKTAYAVAADIGGVMIFRSKCDAPYTYEYSLHRAVEQVLRERIA